MALIKCPDCKTEVSNKAVACPKCGRPNEKKWTLMKEIRQLISLILWICFIGLIFGVAVPAFKEGREAAKRNQSIRQ